MVRDLISIITPCYNSGGFVHRLMDSILLQDYPSVEMFVVDDGSTDDTAEVLKSYIERFEARGYSLTYIYQDNGGQSVAINRALKLISGEYFVWPDSDDFYNSPSALSRLAITLRDSGSKFGVVRCLSEVVDDKTLERCGQFGTVKKHPVDLFVDCLRFRNGFWFGAGNYMVKSEALRRQIPTLEIYTHKKTGQNWQLLLPILYKYKCVTINEALHTITERAESHSRGQLTGIEQQITTYKSFRDTILATLQGIPNITLIDRIIHTYKIKKKYARVIKNIE